MNFIPPLTVAPLSTTDIISLIILGYSVVVTCIALHFWLQVDEAKQELRDLRDDWQELVEKIGRGLAN